MNIKIDKQSSEPVYAQISKYLEQYILTQELLPGDPLPSVRRVAECSGTSVRTAHKAIDLLSREGICYQLPQKGVFVTGRRRVKKSRRPPLVGIYNTSSFGGSPLESIDMALLNGIQEMCAKESREMLIFQELSRETIAHYAHDLCNLDSVIILKADNFGEINALARSFPMITFVSLNYYYPEFDDSPTNVHGVFNDDYAGAYQMTEYLLGQGHNSVIFLTKYIQDLNYKYREMGFQGAVRDNGCDPYDFAVLNIGKAHALPEQFSSQAELLAGNPGASALFCTSDVLASQVLRLPGDVFPEEITLVSYDAFFRDSGVNDNYPVVKIDFAAMGRQAVNLTICGHGEKVIRLKPELVTEPTTNKGDVR